LLQNLLIQSIFTQKLKPETILKTNLNHKTNKLID